MKIIKLILTDTTVVCRLCVFKKMSKRLEYENRIIDILKPALHTSDDH